MSEVECEKADSRVRLPRLNLRPFLVAAMGLLCGIWLYGAALLGEGKAAGIAVFVLFILLMLPPFTIRRAAAVLGVFGVFLLIGLGGVHLAARNFTSGVQEGEYTVTGTGERAAVKDGYMRVTLSSLTFDGVREAGRMELTLPGEDVRTGDVITFTGTVTRNALPSDGDSYALYDFASDFRYGASTSAYEKTGVSANVFLRLAGALYDSLHMYMEEDAAELSYALLTGNTQGVDADFVAETRAGGIAHIFAVSGLHIGMLYGAVTLLLRRWCGRWTFFPAILLSAGYCAMCAFTVSSVRALLMCAFAGGARFFGRKNDLLSSLSLAAVITLLFSPAQFFSVSFRRTALPRPAAFSCSQNDRRLPCGGNLRADLHVPARALVVRVLFPLGTCPQAHRHSRSSRALSASCCVRLSFPCLSVCGKRFARLPAVTLVRASCTLLRRRLFCRACGLFAGRRRRGMACAQSAARCKSAPEGGCAHCCMHCRRGAVCDVRLSRKYDVCRLSDRCFGNGQGNVRSHSYRSDSRSAH